MLCDIIFFVGMELLFDIDMHLKAIKIPPVIERR